MLSVSTAEAENTSGFVPSRNVSYIGGPILFKLMENYRLVFCLSCIHSLPRSFEESKGDFLSLDAVFAF